MKLPAFLVEREGEPRFDPVHLAAVLIGSLAAAGGLFWLLWTLLVYEGGFFRKVRAFGGLLLLGRSLKDYGYEGAPYAMGAFEGVGGNFAALVLTITILVVLHRAYGDAARKHGARR
jgi:hypothetical protein